MKRLNIVSIQQLTKVAVAFSVGIFAFLVGYDNIVDFNTNYQFVDAVLSMNQMKPYFSGNEEITARAITNTNIHLIAYWIIIIGELFAGIICLTGTFIMLISLNKTRFVKGQVIYLVGTTIAVLLWYFGFAVVGGEYFSMWANTMNGQEKAYTFATFILITAIYVAMPYLRVDASMNHQ